jgi:hypothetical protein
VLNPSHLYHRCISRHFDVSCHSGDWVSGQLALKLLALQRNQEFLALIQVAIKKYLEKGAYNLMIQSVDEQLMHGCDLCAKVIN